MTSVWPKRRATALLLLLLLPFTSVGADEGHDGTGAHAGAPHEPEAWEITDSVRCVNETIVVDTDLHIHHNGSLVLDGCTLQMASPAYDDQWVANVDEGLTITVDEGARMELLGGSTVERADPRYGYTIKVDGLFSSDGTSARRNAITGLEGHMAEVFIGGGLKVRAGGVAYVNHTDFRHSEGPALYASKDGRVIARDVTAHNGTGAFASVRGHLEIHGAQAVASIEGIRASGSQIMLANVSVTANQVALHLTKSEGQVVDSTFTGSQTITLKGSRLDLDAVHVSYETIGLTSVPAKDGPEQAVTIRDSSFKPTLGGETIGIQTEGAALSVRGTMLTDSSIGVASQGGSLVLAGNVFEGMRRMDAYVQDPTDFVVEGNQHSTHLLEPVQVAYSFNVRVLERGEPVSGAVVTVAGTERTADDEGHVTFVWRVPLEADRLPAEELSMLVSSGNNSRTVTVPLDERDVAVDLASDSAKEASGPGLFLLLAAVALAWSGSRRH